MPMRMRKIFNLLLMGALIKLCFVALEEYNFDLNL